ncbi:hypothetical protein GCM10011609_84570 [Lentzea pudingi]|uniref:Transcription regulator AsnC/Lrp ligand binding domain-containing protein n=1 Tax=Lentzea pudingi TaxID=1789439 RepID=A0ABQ2ISU0_9PSEU|nr:hypothetical protein GCM10011609_84570 [Lentzea pudingi]
MQIPEVVLTHVAGKLDYVLQVEVADLAAYEDFHANKLAGLPSVAAVNSYVTMKTLAADGQVQCRPQLTGGRAARRPLRVGGTRGRRTWCCPRTRRPP